MEVVSETRPLRSAETDLSGTKSAPPRRTWWHSIHAIRPMFAKHTLSMNPCQKEAA